MNLGVVVIGRNEGERLGKCLESVIAASRPVVYADSGSTDCSIEVARSKGVEVVELDRSMPFTAARGRNEGFQRLIQLDPSVQFVQFVDGDCEMDPGWLQRGEAELVNHPQLAAVCGRLRERFPQASIYNRLCDMEWNGPVGEVPSCGGIAMYRVSCLQAVGGFDQSVPAGEEPELCLRLRRQVWKIVRLPVEMGWHDAAMMYFGQWWRRAVRSGYGGLDVVRRFEREKPGMAFSSQIRSARIWGLGLPFLICVAASVGYLAHGVSGAVVWAAVVALLLPMQIVRIAMRARRQSIPWSAALAYGAFTMLAKWASLVGQWRWWCDHLAGRHARLIEHKLLQPPGLAASRSGS